MQILEEGESVTCFEAAVPEPVAKRSRTKPYGSVVAGLVPDAAHNYLLVVIDGWDGSPTVPEFGVMPGTFSSISKVQSSPHKFSDAMVSGLRKLKEDVYVLAHAYDVLEVESNRKVMKEKKQQSESHWRKIDE